MRNQVFTIIILFGINYFFMCVTGGPLPRTDVEQVIGLLISFLRSGPIHLMRRGQLPLPLALGVRPALGYAVMSIIRLANSANSANATIVANETIAANPAIAANETLAANITIAFI